MTKQTTGGMRLMLLVAAGLVFVAGVQLFVFSEQTAVYFAWTVQPPLTAAFLGAAYWSACVIELLAARRTTWADARIAVPAVLIFTTVTLIVTLLHLDRFHLDAPALVTRGAAWAWLAVYGLVPPLLAVLLVIQMRQLGVDPVRSRPLPGWTRLLLAAQALLLAGTGVTLLLTPWLLLEQWPWQLTPLTARALGAWLFGIGVAAAQAADENDWRRVQPASAAYATFGTLTLVALLRYPADVRWDRPLAYVLIGVLLLMLVCGVFGWRQAERYR